LYNLVVCTILILKDNKSQQQLEKGNHWFSYTFRRNQPSDHSKVSQLLVHPVIVILEDLDPRPLSVNDHTSVLPYEMYGLEPGETPSHTVTWKPLGFLSHIKHRTNDDRLPISLWEVWFFSTLGVPIPALIGPSHSVSVTLFIMIGPSHSVSVTLLKMTRMEIICRPAKSSLRLRIIGFMTGLYTSWVAFWDRWVIELRSTRLRRSRVKNGTVLRCLPKTKN
jgi:hypothetical protein